MTANKTTISRILTVLKEVGPMTSRELGEHMGWARSYARSAVAHCRKNTEKLIYIKQWVRSEEYGTLYLRPVYAAGSESDAKKPKPLGRNTYNQRHRAKKRKQLASIFELAIPVDKRRLTTRKRPDAAERIRNRVGESLGSP